MQIWLQVNSFASYLYFVHLLQVNKSYLKILVLISGAGFNLHSETKDSGAGFKILVLKKSYIIK
jgi:hypothetical protein